MSETISVIVPVYNVETYLNECIESICNQTYTNLEIVLVDDGSVDGSGILCDEWINKDSRVKVIHKANGGLSSARNVGIENATGELISFCDSDDYMFPEMLNKLAKYLIKCNADIACCRYASNEVPKSSREKIQLIEYESWTAINNILNDTGYKCFAWNKLYKANLFDGIRYPEGELYEDIKTSYLLFKKAKHIVYIPEELYFYRNRKGSITKNKFKPKDYDLLHAINYVVNDAGKCKKTSIDGLKMGYISYYFEFVKKAYKSGYILKNEIKYLKNIIKSNLKVIVITGRHNVIFIRRAQILFFLLFDKIYFFIISKYLKKEMDKEKEK